MPIVMGEVWTGGFFGNATVEIDASAQIVDAPVLVSQSIPDFNNLGINDSVDMSQYVTDLQGLITDSDVLNRNPAIATYEHSTWLLTRVGAGDLTKLQLWVSGDW